ncbi:hypothetical protein [Haloarcula onubensis]|nr:hypothetical protein [Halomicroarcula sp. S3CR25-11]
MTDSSATEPSRPQFRGCVFCYSAAWAYYSLRKATGAVGSDTAQN